MIRSILIFLIIIDHYYNTVLSSSELKICANTDLNCKSKLIFNLAV